MLSSRLPNFFLVGAPKCATTSMNAYLGQHPEVYMCPEKETHFFAGDLYPESERCGWEHYRGLFAGADTESVRGESSVFYLLSRTAAADLAAFAPDAKILVMLRNPLDVIESHHSQIVYEGLEPEKDVENAIRLEDSRKVGLSSEQTSYKDRVQHYRDVVRFGEQIARFREHFAPEQIHIMIYDDFIVDPESEYAKILAFLGVDPTFTPMFERMNGNKTVRSSTLRTLLYETPDTLTKFSRIILPNYTVRRRVRNAIKRLNTNYRPRRGMPAGLRREIARDLQSDVADLSNMVGRDLTPWLADFPLARPDVDAAAEPGYRSSAVPAAADHPARLTTG